MKWLVGVVGGLFVLFGVVWYGTVPEDFPVPERQDITISGVTVINPGVERLVDQTIVVQGGLITAIRPRGADDPAPLCEDCFALPGLIDAHVHTPPRAVIGNQRLFALLYLAHGVTSVRDVGQSEPGIAEFARGLNEGEIVGPHMYRCGPVLEGTPPAWPVATIVETAEEARAIATQLVDEGVDCLKIYNEVKLDAYEAIAAVGQERGVPVIGHVPHAVGLQGVSNFESQHLTGVPYVALPRPPMGWDVRDVDILAMSEDDIEEVLQIAEARNISFTPALANFALRLTDSDRERFPPTPAAAHLPDFWSDSWQLVAGHPTGDEAIATKLASVERMYDIVGRIHGAGLDVLAGTDTLMPWVVPGESLLLELDELEKAMGDREAVLVTATTVNGRHIAPGEVGVIAVGARADILLLAGDPVVSLSALPDWKVLVADGRLYPRETIDEWLDVYDAHFHGIIYDTAISGLVSLIAGQFTKAPNEE
ncbi:MAG: amidohydrolase family protein [Rhodobiaceae bacterium]|nr:amidohydrolase family protein [Rhodobiaceae bacterium]